MEDPEVPLEQSQEHIQEHALHGKGGEGEGHPSKKWIMGVALSSAVFAALAAVASLQAGHHANEAIVAQIEGSTEIMQASDVWSEYQAKGIKGAIAANRISLLKSLDKTPAPEDAAAVDKYATEQEKLFAEAHEHERKAKDYREEGAHHLSIHIPLARAVTMFQVSIAVAAISVLTQRRLFWWVSLLFGAVGVYFAAAGFAR